mmetsp:Transcript_12886/g.40483  ORF Transcript_12886/g.40483 Transcript_12886/m.40483 type:complete len:163 (+) Transcript_12886:79-567(+)
MVAGMPRLQDGASAAAAAAALSRLEALATEGCRESVDGPEQRGGASRLRGRRVSFGSVCYHSVPCAAEAPDTPSPGAFRQPWSTSEATGHEEHEAGSSSDDDEDAQEEYRRLCNRVSATEKRRMRSGLTPHRGPTVPCGSFSPNGSALWRRRLQNQHAAPVC